MTRAFTLLEVAISAMIISVVIGAMLQIFSNNSNYFSGFEKKLDVTWASTLLLGNQDIGFDDKTEELKSLVSSTDMRMDFIQYLDDTEAKITYQVIMLIDSMDIQESIDERSEEEGDEYSSTEDASSDGINLEIGKTIFNVNDTSTYMIRIRTQ